jgi:hypothetical protein
MKKLEKLDWNSIRKIGREDNARRWYPYPEVAEYFASLRSPSRAWPHSYAKGAQTIKFAKWLAEKKPALAKQLGVLE